MENLIQITTLEELKRIGSFSGVPPLDHMDMIRHSPDAHLILVRNNVEIVARLSLWWRKVPDLRGRRPGLIGHYRAEDIAASHQILLRACEKLAGVGCDTAVGPMDGSIWRRRELVINRGGNPPFFLEPDSPDDWARSFFDQGFNVFASYVSAMSAEVGEKLSETREADRCLEDLGVRILSVDPDRFEEELRRMFEVARFSLRNEPLYAPFSVAEFVEKGMAIKPDLRPGLSLIAERGGAPVGYVIAAPDGLQAKRGDPVDTVVIGSLSVLPEREYRELAEILEGRVLSMAVAMGYGKAIRSVVREEDYSSRLKDLYPLVIRQYALFSKPLKL